jgi:predicted RNA-binding Zn-ribbon protein involved in translation (DUF1610 family)
VTKRPPDASIERDAGRRATIFDAVSSSPLDDRYETGSFAGAGTFFCLLCGAQLSLEESEALPECPHCGSARFRRDSIFEDRQEHGNTVEIPVLDHTAAPAWLHEVRASLPRPGHYLAYEIDGEVEVFAIERGWTRIGRSVAADLRLDDPSVSRRHALVVAEPGKGLRVLDDRSLNGVFVNGEPVEWGPLEDGDELTVGRYCLYALAH